MSYFDEAALKWDDNPDHVKRAGVISEKIIATVPLSTEWSALEYGCGTGLVSFFLHSRLRSVTLVDDSAEMLKVVRQKIERDKILTMKTVHVNFLTDSYEKKHDFIYTVMVLHHIPETKRIIEKFFSILKTGGYLCIADLVKEDGTFHAHHDHYTGHNGFHPGTLKETLESAGFCAVQSALVYTIERQTNVNPVREYPVFLMTGKKA